MDFRRRILGTGRDARASYALIFSGRKVNPLFRSFFVIVKKDVASFLRVCFYLHRQHDAGEQKNKTESQNMKTKIEVGTWVRMTSENSNWNVGEKGRISFIGSDRVGVYFPERGDTEDDDYTAFYDDFGAL